LRDEAVGLFNMLFTGRKEERRERERYKRDRGQKKERRRRIQCIYNTDFSFIIADGIGIGTRWMDG
jgi:hypothetical protein